MSFKQPLGQMRAAVASYSSLPLTGNVLGDLRIISDVGTLYTWMLSSSSGTLSDWQKVTVSSYSDLKNRPNASPLAIDTAISIARNIYLNYVYLFFVNMAYGSIRILKMVEGVLDSFPGTEGIDSVHSSGQRYFLADVYGKGYYRNNFNGDLDSYTKFLIRGYNYKTPSFVDALYNSIVSYDTEIDTVITKFGNKSFSFDGSSSSGLLLTPPNGTGAANSPCRVSGVDFTWEFWVRTNTDSAETIVLDRSLNAVDGANFKIEKLANKKIKVSLRGADTYSDGAPNYIYPVSPVSYDVTSTNTVEKETWYHLALTRQSGYLKLWLNGNLEGTSSVADTQDIIDYRYNINVYQDIGIRVGQGLNGRIEEIRFSKGIARYTSNFTPRTTSFNTPTQSVPCNNMILQSNGYEANSVPSSARIVIFEQDAVLSYDPEVVESITPNTDIKVFISRDAGTTFTQATDLKYEFNIYQEVVWGSIYNNVNFLVGTVDLSSQPNGKEIVWKITTHNNKDILIRSVACNWK